ncbi:hypothetical protein [Neorhizobium sp. NCHU2750]|uniref:hypothetical protein n=1 Tax=Neorhizobium sp. NCHU2750 TaxID=1825976 RepID=UPI000EB6835A|nr:hypothetical protein NCHU2750_58190 [Neorhizobium sp. NCHU2750]
MSVIPDGRDQHSPGPKGLRTIARQYFDEGYTAARDGIQAIANPYMFDQTTERMDVWFDGFYSFQRNKLRAHP